MACLNFKTGEVLWNERDSDKRRVTKGSVAFADGRIYYRTEEGPIVLIEPSRKEYLERGRFAQPERTDKPAWADRKSTRLISSHSQISYAVFCLKKKKQRQLPLPQSIPPL